MRAREAAARRGRSVLRNLFLVVMAGLAAIAFLPGRGFADSAYPSRPITLVVAFEPGGSSDISARLVAQELAKVLGQPVIIENRPGAGGRAGTRRAADAAADGYTLLWGSGSSLTVSPSLYEDQQYVRQLSPISLGVTQPFIFVTSATMGVKSVQELVVIARQRPGKLNFASAGAGSSNHLLGEIFMAVTGTEFEHIPYRGGASAREAVLRDEAQLMNEVISPLIGSIQAGRLQPLFITSDARHPMFPDVPTAAEAGLPDLAIVGFFALLAPAKTPESVVQRLNAAMKDALSSPGLRSALDASGFDTAYSSPAELAQRIENGRRQYGAIIASKNISIK